MMTNSTPRYPDTAEQSLWIAQARQGDQRAFCQLVQKYQQPVFNACYYMLKDTADAEDAAQEIFLRAYTKLNTYDDTRQFSTWLFAIASHYCIDCWKKRRWQQVPWDDLENCLSVGEMAWPDRMAQRKESAQETRAMLAALPADYRLLIVFKYWHAMSYKEMAQTLDTTTGAVKSKLFRARKILAQKVLSQPAAMGYDNRMALVGSC
jgi:RNA polymerase sigma-70 factor (ECF subfamily)